MNINKELSQEKEKEKDKDKDFEKETKKVELEEKKDTKELEPKVENIQPDFEKKTQEPEKIIQDTVGYIPDEEEEPEKKVPSIKKESSETLDLSNLKTERDEDLIEKPWVNKAGQIIKEYEDNPHKEDNEEAKLQVKYLKDRFGREVKRPKD